MKVRWIAALTVCAHLALGGGLAEAAPTAQQRASAKTQYTAAKRLSLQGKHEEAAAALRNAVNDDPKAQYQLDFARALVKTKQLVEAREQAEAVMASKEPNTTRAKQAAQQLKKDLDARIPTMKLEVVGGDASARVTVNGEAVEVGADKPYDPGNYTVRAQSGADLEVTERVDLAESQHRVVSLDLGKRASAKSTEPKKEGSGGNMAPAAVFYGVGGAGLIAGGVLGVLAFNKTSEVEELCGGNVCPPEYEGEVALAQDYGTASTVAFAAGGLCVVTAIILTVTVGIGSGPSKEEKKEGAWVRPFAGTGPAGDGVGAGVYGAF